MSNYDKATNLLFLFRKFRMSIHPKEKTMEEKLIYVTPKLEIITLTEDVIVTSGENDQETNSDGGELWGA